MRNIAGAKAFSAIVVLAIAPFSLSDAVSADTTLLSLTNPASHINSPYSYDFVASDTTMTISIGGYQLPSWETVTAAKVTLDGAGPNLLGRTWSFAASEQGSDAFTFKDSSYVPGLQFGGFSEGNYDTFSQVLMTTIGDSYTLSFLFSNNAYGPANGAGPSGLLVSYHPDGPLPGGGGGASPQQNTSVPEPSTWALALLGFAALGYAGRNRKRGNIALADA